jgi:hypothetical protein
MLQVLAPTATAPHAQTTSTGTADVHTLTAPPGAKFVMLGCLTNGCYFTVDGSTPTAANGMPLPSGALPILLPVNGDIKVCSQAAAAASVIDALWLR